MVEPNFERLRDAMVEQQIEARGISSARVLDAMRRVRRERFVTTDMEDLAYSDGPLPIGEGQTISQPYIVAYMAEALRLESGDRVLEVGAGCGYAAAVLAALASEVFTIERHATLAERARNNLQSERCSNVHVRCGDGTKGWPEAAPFDAIVVAAAGPTVPKALLDQRRAGGRLVMPVGHEGGLQTLRRVTRSSPEDYTDEELEHVQFVPLVRGEAN